MYKSDNNIANGIRIDPDKQQLMRRLKAGENVLTRVRQEKNNLQDANTQLGEELKDVRAQLSDSIKENRRLRRGIFSKCLNEPSKKSSARKSIDRVMSLGMLTKVRREKNGLQDANTMLDVELKDVRGQLSDSTKENQRLRRGIFSKCLNEL